MKYHLIKRPTIIATIGLALLMPCHFLQADDQPVIEKIHKTISHDLTNLQELELLESYHKHSRALELLLLNCLHNPHKEHYLVHVIKLENTIELYEKNLVKVVEAKLTQEQDAQKRAALEKTKKILNEILFDLREICITLKDYNGSANIFDLALLGNKLSIKKHRLPEKIRKWTIAQWKKALQDLMSCPAQ